MIQKSAIVKIRKRSTKTTIELLNVKKLMKNDVFSNMIFFCCCFINFYSTIFYSTIFYSTIFYLTVFHSTVFHFIIFYSIIFHSTIFYSTATDIHRRKQTKKNLHSTLFVSIWNNWENYIKQIFDDCSWKNNNAKNTSK